MMKAGWDSLAALLSSLCLVHCLALPVGAVMLPSLLGAHLLPGHWLAWHGLHWVLLAVAMPFSVHALLSGRATHRLPGPFGLAAAGFAAMVAGAMVHDHGVVEQVLTVAGGLAVASAHGWNWSARRAALRARATMPRT